VIFAFIAYLFAIVLVLIDVFRDHSVPGWGKALWVLFLVFVPFLTVLVYVIARGAGMSERLRSRGDGPPAEDYAMPQGMPNPATEIATAKDLADRGIISQGEFDAIKNKALGNRY